MDSTLLAALALGFISGFKHAFEPDHVIAVSTLMHQAPKPSRALRMGLAWGAGHTTTLVIGVLLIGLLGLNVHEAMLEYFELPVALMLIVLGGWATFDAIRRMRSLHRHTHDGIEHFHVGQQPHPHGFARMRSGWRGYLVGMVHGLAGSGALLLLVAATLPTLLTGILYAVIFGLGSVAGMGAVSVGIAVPFLASRSRPVIYGVLTGLSGAISIVLGVSILRAVLM